MPSNSSDAYTLATSISVDGLMRPRFNSAGAAISDTDEELLKFWKWFGDSAMIDAEHRPLVFYHGTNLQFETFDPNLAGSNYPDSIGGFFFTSDLEAAQEYAEDTACERGGDPVVFSAYLNIEHPFVSEIEHGNPDRYYDRNSARILNQALDNECDGVVIKSTYRPETIQDTIVAFLPEQIASTQHYATLKQNLTTEPRDSGHRNRLR